MIWLSRGITVFVGTSLLALAILFGGSGFIMRRNVDIDLPAIQAATAPDDIAEGARLAAIMGCTRCHGDMGQGRRMSGVPYIGRIIAPSLPRVAARATDGQLARAIRNGVGIDARPLFIMPSRDFNHLADEDVARLIGWIRTQPTSAFDVVGDTPVGFRGRFAMVTGRLRDSAIGRTSQPRRRPSALGPYLTQASCLQCHDLSRAKATPSDGRVAPALYPATAGYGTAEFEALLRNGQRADKGTVPGMAEAARNGLERLSDAEIEAIRVFLTKTAPHS